jgi:hypothetical protein
MSTHALTLQFLAWVAERPRTRADVMEAWRSTCPRLSIWEDATIDRLVCFENRQVVLTPRGRALLDADGQRAPVQPAAEVVRRDERGREPELVAYSTLRG